jgi:hypothetical protein
MEAVPPPTAHLPEKDMNPTDTKQRSMETVQLTGWEDGATDGELLLPTESFLRLVYGRLDPDHTPPLELTGPVTLDELRAVFPGV